MPIPSRRNISEDAVVSSAGSGLSFSDLPHLSRSTPHLPPQPGTPPAIPARVALPASQFSLFEIDFVSSRDDSPELTTPEGTGSSDFPLPDNLFAPSPHSAEASLPDTPDPLPSSTVHDTNSTQSNRLGESCEQVLQPWVLSVCMRVVCTFACTNTAP